HLVAPAELHSAAHARAGRYGERAAFQVSVEDASRQQLDARGALDVAFDLTPDRDRVRAHAARELGARVDRQITLDVDITLELSRDAHVARAIDLARDGDVGGDDGFLRVARCGAPSGSRSNVCRAVGLSVHHGF